MLIRQSPCLRRSQSVDVNLCHACKKSINNTQNEVERHPWPDIHSRRGPQCRANLRHEQLTFWHDPLSFDVLDLSTFWTGTVGLAPWLTSLTQSNGAGDAPGPEWCTRRVNNIYKMFDGSLRTMHNDTCLCGAKRLNWFLTWLRHPMSLFTL